MKKKGTLIIEGFLGNQALGTLMERALEVSKSCPIGLTTRRTLRWIKSARRGQDSFSGNHRPLLVGSSFFMGLYLESSKVIPKKELLGCVRWYLRGMWLLSAWARAAERACLLVAVDENRVLAHVMV